MSGFKGAMSKFYGECRQATLWLGRPSASLAGSSAAQVLQEASGQAFGGRGTASGAQPAAAAAAGAPPATATDRLPSSALPVCLCLQGSSRCR
jgi:hypothetical protein